MVLVTSAGDILMFSMAALIQKIPIKRLLVNQITINLTSAYEGYRASGLVG